MFYFTKSTQKSSKRSRNPSEMLCTVTMTVLDVFDSTVPSKCEACATLGRSRLDGVDRNLKEELSLQMSVVTTRQGNLSIL